MAVMGERGSSRTACSKCARAASQRPEEGFGLPTSLSSSAFPGARASAVLSVVKARR
jgi:hypothetical protein